MSFMEKIKKLIAANNIIGFRANASQIQVLKKPSEFYDKLLEKCKSAENRIVIASLYLGTGQLEKEFVSAICQRMSEKPQLSVHMLLDCMRGSRGNDNSRKMLLPLLQKHPETVKVNLYHTPKYRGILKKILPNRYNEIVGLQHMKLYLFDNDLIITGANLSSDYFTHRQDRYIIINNCQQLGDFVANLCSKVSDFSFQVDSHNKLQFNRACGSHPIQSELKDFVKNAKQQILHFYYSNINTTSEHKKGVSEDTIIYPMLEMGQFGINQDSEVTRKLIEECPANSETEIATGYFNMTKDYEDSIILKSKSNFKVLMAHPTANGFYNAKGPAGGIPKGYSELAGKFLDRIIAAKQMHRIKMLEYTRSSWTFHAKGLWLSPQPDSLPFLTCIGSPNFGERSVHHDLECQFVLITSNPELQKSLKEECNNLFKYGVPYTSVERQRKPPLWVKIVINLFKTYL